MLCDNPIWKKYKESNGDIPSSDDGMAYNFAPTWFSSNENLDEVMDILQVRGKSVLTVCSGGDQPMMFQARGATEIETFDRSGLAWICLYLKDRMNRTLDYDSYSDFLSVVHKEKSVKILDFYNNFLRQKFPPEFNESMTTLISRSQYKIRNGYGYYFIMPEPDFHALAERPIANCQFYWKDVMDLHTEVKQKFDIIYLSNIIDHKVREAFETDNAITSYELVSKFFPILNSGGIIADYAFTSHFERSNWAARHHLTKNHKLFIYKHSGTSR